MVKRAFQVSDGLASLASKKIHSFIKELQGEGVLTAKEAESVRKNLGKAKEVFYDNVTRELKKVLTRAAKQKNKKRPTKKAKKRARR